MIDSCENLHTPDQPDGSYRILLLLNDVKYKVNMSLYVECTMKKKSILFLQTVSLHTLLLYGVVIFIASEAEHLVAIKCLFQGFESLPAVCTYLQRPTPPFRLWKYAA